MESTIHHHGRRFHKHRLFRALVQYPPSPLRTRAPRDALARKPAMRIHLNPQLLLQLFERLQLLLVDMSRRRRAACRGRNRGDARQSPPNRAPEVPRRAALRGLGRSAPGPALSSSRFAIHRSKPPGSSLLAAHSSSGGRCRKQTRWQGSNGARVFFV